MIRSRTWYFGKKRHEPDLDEVLRRAGESGVTHIIVTAGTLRESRRAVDLVRRLRGEELYGEMMGYY